MLMDQVNGFSRAKEEMGEKGDGLTLSLSRVGFATKNDTDRKKKIEAANRYYSRFDNVFTGPGIVDKGMVRELPRKQTIEELGDSLLIGTPQEIIDKLEPYAKLGIDRVIINVNFGCDAQETLDGIQLFAEEIMPYFSTHCREVKSAAG
jgi:alkanesulfonate monooxygenase SsuD/methylene tetrahydromethanopterin reductase-like flavin-dependent oxidoreductase (luciferase family)